MSGNKIWFINLISADFFALVASVSMRPYFSTKHFICNGVNEGSVNTVHVNVILSLTLLILYFKAVCAKKYFKLLET